MFGNLLQKARKAVEGALGFDGIDLNLSSNSYLDLFRGSSDQANASGGIPRALLERIMTMDMPGGSYSGTIELSEDEIDLRRRLQGHVT